jgi:hypothetical protein
MKSTYQNKDWDSLSAAAKAEIAKVAIQKGIYSLDGIKNMYNEFAMGGDTSNTVPLGRRYWQAQSNTPTILEKKNTWVKQQKAIKDRENKALRKWIQTEGVKELNRKVKDYLTTSNDNTWTTANRHPKNPHLQDRVTKGAKAHALWEKEHPVLNTWGNVLGAVPFAVASAPLAAAAGSGMAALGDAVAATSAGQAITAGLAPLATAASTSVAGAPLYTWADVGLSSLFGGHGIQTAINEGGISPTTALEIAPLGRLSRPILNKVTTAIRNYNYPLGKPYVPKNFSTIKPQVRTKVGDVEINNPNLLYHLDRGNGVGAFSNQGAYIQDGMLFPGTPKESSAIPYSWWNKGKPYATSVNGQPMTRLVTTTKDSPGMIHVKSQNYPIGQWNGKRGFVLPSEYVNPKGVNVEESTYMLDPNYGWKRVLSKDIPTAKWHINKTAPKITSENASNITPEQWTAAQDAAIAKALNITPEEVTSLTKEQLDAAIANGADMAEAQRLRNSHYMTKAPNTSARYNSYTPTSLQHGTDIPNHYVFGDELSFFNTHGGYDKTYRQNVYVNVPKLRVTNPKGYEIGHEYDLLLDADKGLSDGFVELGGTEITEAEENYLMNNMDKVFGITPEEYRKLYETLPNYKDPSEIQLLKNDYPFIQFQQSHIDKEGIGEWYPLVSELAVKNPKNIKLADAVTFDDNGVRIPLGLRDNFGLNEIRWGLVPFGVGLTGYGLLKNQKTSTTHEAD